MIILQVLLLSGVLLPALSAPNLPRALALMGEAKARAIASRVRAKTNSAILLQQMRTPSVIRVRRDLEDTFDPFFEPTQFSRQTPEVFTHEPKEDEQVGATRSQEDTENRRPSLEEALEHIMRANHEFQKASHQHLMKNLDQLQELQRSGQNFFRFPTLPERHEEANEQMNKAVLGAELPNNAKLEEEEEDTPEDDLRDAEAHFHQFNHQSFIPTVPIHGLQNLHTPLNQNVNINNNHNQIIHSGLQPSHHNSQFFPHNSFIEHSQQIPHFKQAAEELEEVSKDVLGAELSNNAKLEDTPEDEMRDAEEHLHSHSLRPQLLNDAQLEVEDTPEDEMRDAEEHLHSHSLLGAELPNNAKLEVEDTPEDAKMRNAEAHFDSHSLGAELPNNDMRDADAFFHSHIFNHQHNHQSFIPTIPVPGLNNFQTPLNQNVNINTNQNIIHSGLQPSLHSSSIFPHSSSFQQSQQIPFLKEASENHNPSTFDPLNQREEVLNFLERHKFDLPLREANPHLTKFKKMEKFRFIPIQPYPHNYQPYPFYREADDQTLQEADPHFNKLHKKKKFQGQQQYPSFFQPYQMYSREADQNLEEDSENHIGTPYLIDVKNNNYFVPYPERYSRSIDTTLDEIVGKEREFLANLKSRSGDNPDLDFISHIGHNILSDLENRRKVKRSIPLTRLIHDPKVKLDIPKTVENFGTATKQAFEDERAPMYHLKNLVGSSKNAFLSAMRIPPQNIIIPTDYEIVKNDDENVGAINPSIQSRMGEDDDPLGFSDTFKKVGAMVRGTIKSSQDTASHINDIANDARNILHTARYSTPRLILPYSRVTAIQDSRKRTPLSNSVLITPRILDLAQERVGKSADSNTRPNFVKLGELMDAVGLSNPNKQQLGLHKFTFQPKNNVEEAVHSLEDAKVSVGAKNLREFLVKMRNELTQKEPKRINLHTRRQKENKEVGKFVETLFDGSKNETVGLQLPPELLHPFMNRPSKVEVRNFLRDNGDEVEDTPKTIVGLNLDDHTLGEFLDYIKKKEAESKVQGEVLGAINPIMFERTFNESLKVNNETMVGKGLNLNGHLTKPFMEKAPQDARDELYDTYNRDDVIYVGDD